MPVFPSKYRTVTKRKIDVDTCTVGDTIRVFRILIQNQGDCFSADCWLECTACHGKGDKGFWLTKGTVILIPCYKPTFCLFVREREREREREIAQSV